MMPTEDRLRQVPGGWLLAQDLRDQPLLVRRAAADDAALGDVVLLLPHHRSRPQSLHLLEKLLRLCLQALHAATPGQRVAAEC